MTAAGAAPLDLDRLDPDTPEGARALEILGGVAAGAAQMRRAALAAQEAGVHTVADEGRPRAVLVVGIGEGADAADAFAAACDATAPVPVISHRGPGLPGWVGSMDLVVAADGSGRAPETGAVLAEAARRGSRIFAVAPEDGPVADAVAVSRGILVPLPALSRYPGALTEGGRILWSLLAPLLLAAPALGLAGPGIADVEAAAVCLEELSRRCRPDADSFVNPAKGLAAELALGAPIIWATSPLLGVAARRLARELAGGSGLAAVSGVLPDAGRRDAGLLVPSRGGGGGDPDDMFRDRADDVERPEPTLVLLRDLPAVEAPLVAARAATLAEVAAEEGTPVRTLLAEGTSVLERLASVVGLIDWVAAYAALGAGDLAPRRAAAGRVGVAMQAAALQLSTDSAPGSPPPVPTP